MTKIITKRQLKTYKESNCLRTYTDDRTSEIMIAFAAESGKTKSAILHLIVKEKMYRMPASEKERLLKLFNTLTPEEKKYPHRYLLNKEKE